LDDIFFVFLEFLELFRELCRNFGESVQKRGTRRETIGALRKRERLEPTNAVRVSTRTETRGFTSVLIRIIGTCGSWVISFAYTVAEKNTFFLKKGAFEGGLRLFKGRIVVYNVKAIVAYRYWNEPIATLDRLTRERANVAASGFFGAERELAININRKIGRRVEARRY